MAGAVAQNEVVHIDAVLFEAQEVIEVGYPGVLLVKMLGNTLDAPQFCELLLSQA
ncbi:hypothetical protein [Stenotrophomonas sp. SY1]|uniref:hypothetical protein n=1 Tax=Stenotrophomonas sp. SY1 TaxID=477235 RepID=UPI001E52698F|nr:hypothetical protein [Stenotrophomonas sp. SY1]